MRERETEGQDKTAAKKDRKKEEIPSEGKIRGEMNTGKRDKQTERD